MSTTQLLLSHAAVRVDIRSRDIRFPLSPWQRMNKRGRLKTIGHVDLWNLVSIAIFCGHRKNEKKKKEMAYML